MEETKGRQVVILDTETNKLQDPEIAQLSCIFMGEDLKPTETLNIYFKLDYMSEGAYNVHGLSLEQLDKLSGGTRFRDIAEDLMEKLKDCLIVGHNIAFDMRVLNGELNRAIGKTLDNETSCTMLNYTPIIGLKTKTGRAKWPKLVQVMNYLGRTDDYCLELCKKLYGDEETGYHDARFDTTCTYLAYGTYIRTGGIV